MAPWRNWIAHQISALRVTGLNPVGVTNKSKSKLNHQACFFDLAAFWFSKRSFIRMLKAILKVSWSFEFRKSTQLIHTFRFSKRSFVRMLKAILIGGFLKMELYLDQPSKSLLFWFSGVSIFKPDFIVNSRCHR